MDSSSNRNASKSNTVKILTTLPLIDFSKYRSTEAINDFNAIIQSDVPFGKNRTTSIIKKRNEQANKLIVKFTKQSHNWRKTAEEERLRSAKLIKEMCVLKEQIRTYKGMFSIELFKMREKELLDEVVFLRQQLQLLTSEINSLTSIKDIVKEENVKLELNWENLERITFDSLGGKEQLTNYASLFGGDANIAILQQKIDLEVLSFFEDKYARCKIEAKIDNKCDSDMLDLQKENTNLLEKIDICQNKITSLQKDLNQRDVDIKCLLETLQKRRFVKDDNGFISG